MCSNFQVIDKRIFLKENYWRYKALSNLQFEILIKEQNTWD